MSENLNFPPFEELQKDEFGRIIFPAGYPVDMLPTDEHGFIMTPAGYMGYHEALEENRRRFGASLSNKVNVEPPVGFEINSIVTAGYNGSGYYYKDQQGLVTIQGSIGNPDGITDTNNLIATLPVGFRPSFPALIIAAALMENSYLAPVFVTFHQDGQVRAYLIPDGTNHISVLGSYFTL